MAAQNQQGDPRQGQETLACKIARLDPKLPAGGLRLQGLAQMVDDLEFFFRGIALLISRLRLAVQP